MSVNDKNNLVARARRLRRNATDAEKLLWSALREPGFAQAKFRRQAPIGKFIVDFVSYKAKLVVEVDGGQHAETNQSSYDAARTQWLESQGFKVLRFWNDEVLTQTDGVLAVIFQSLEDANPPSPPPSARSPSP